MLHSKYQTMFGSDLIRRIYAPKERCIIVKNNSGNRIIEIMYIFYPPKKNLDLRIFILYFHIVNIPHTQQSSNLQTKIYSRLVHTIKQYKLRPSTNFNHIFVISNSIVEIVISIANMSSGLFNFVLSACHH